MKKYFSVVLSCSLIFALETHALNFLKRKSGYEIVLDDDKEDSGFERLLCKSNLRLGDQQRIANICLSHPQSCCEINLFEKISPNLIMPDKKRFSSKLLDQYKAPSQANIPPFHRTGSGNLLNELMEQKNLNPHARVSTQDGDDLALEILRSNDKALIKKLLNNTSFNPAAKYRSMPLATLLIFSKNYDVLFDLANKFGPDINGFDSINRRPVYYLLDKFHENPQPLLIKTMMGHKLGSWHMAGLGLLENITHFEALFNSILCANKERQIVFIKIIKHLILWNEKDQDNTGYYFDVLIKLFRHDLFNYKIFINEDFTEKALRLLNSFNLLNQLDLTQEIITRDFWLKNEAENRDQSSDKTIAKNLHIINHANTNCFGCMQPAKTLYKSSRWCIHAYCLNCWMKEFNQEKGNKITQCPHAQCTIALPPSLFLALEYDQANVEKETLKKAHASCQDFHKNFDEQLINKLNAAAQCQKCLQFLLLDSTNPKNRTIQCSCDARYMVIANAEGGLLPIDAFHNLGKCQCGALVEFAGRAGNNQQIDCPFCKRTRLWTPLK